jgi:hypothetical protein
MGSTQRQIDDMTRHWVHARVRYRARYGKELEREEWQRVSDKFRQHQVPGATHTPDGKVEGWVLVYGEWAFTVYSPMHQSVVTFLPCPPPMPSKVPGIPAAPAVPPAPVVQGGKQIAKAMRRSQENDLREVRAKHADEMKELRKEILDLQQACARRTDDISWFKDNIRDVSHHLWMGRFVDAALLVETLGGLPKGLHPHKDLDAAAAKVLEMNDARREVVRTKWVSRGLPENVSTHPGINPALIGQTP